MCTVVKLYSWQVLNMQRIAVTLRLIKVLLRFQKVPFISLVTISSGISSRILPHVNYNIQILRYIANTHNSFNYLFLPRSPYLKKPYNR